jgi:hypothetical protein
MRCQDDFQSTASSLVSGAQLVRAETIPKECVESDQHGCRDGRAGFEDMLPITNQGSSEASLLDLGES